MPNYEPQMQVVSLLRNKSPTKDTGGPCIWSSCSALGPMAAGILESKSGGVDSKTSSRRYRVLLTADDICAKVLVYHDLQRGGAVDAILEYEMSKDRDALKSASLPRLQPSFIISIPSSISES
jgi:hypothetical protein